MPPHVSDSSPQDTKPFSSPCRGYMKSFFCCPRSCHPFHFQHQGLPQTVVALTRSQQSCLSPVPRYLLGPVLQRTTISGRAGCTPGDVCQAHSRSAFWRGVLQPWRDLYRSLHKHATWYICRCPPSPPSLSLSICRSLQALHTCIPHIRSLSWSAGPQPFQDEFRRLLGERPAPRACRNAGEQAWCRGTQEVGQLCCG